jgi:hypothetical protein
MADALSARGHFGHTSEYTTRNWADTQIPTSVEYSDLFRPEFWKHHATKFKPTDLIRIRRVDGAWDLMLVVVAAQKGGLLVEEWPKWPKEAETAAAEIEKATAIQPRELNGRMVPRVEHTPRTKWRVIGLDGNEISRSHETKEAADEALRVYAASLGKEIAA